MSEITYPTQRNRPILPTGQNDLPAVRRTLEEQSDIAEVSQTLVNPADVDDEIRQLFGVLSK